jgi:hypothetical protein
MDSNILKITKSANITSYQKPGNVIGYTYKVSNTGSVGIMGIINVTDNMTGTLKIPINGLLELGNNVSATSSYTVQQSDLDNGSVTNSAYATAGSTISGSVAKNPKI